METWSKKYERLVQMLREREPVLDDPGSVADRVMEEIRRRKAAKHGQSLITGLFAWAYVGWFRNVLTLGAFILVLFFISQHVVLFNMVKSLEERVLQSGYDYYQSPYPSSPRLLRYVSPEDLHLSDSVKISKQDLLNFLQSYRDMEISYDKLKASLQEEMRKQNRRENSGRKPLKNHAL